MANWSDTTIQLSGNSEAIQNAHNFIEKYSKEGYLDPSALMKDTSVSSRAKYTIMAIEDYFRDNTSIQIYGQGRWCAPSGFFKDIVNKFDLEIDYVDSENGSDFCHIIQGNKNNLTEKEYPYWSIEHFNSRGGATTFFDNINDWYDEENPDTQIEKLIKYYSTPRIIGEENFD